jgi:hypothetical protein
MWCGVCVLLALVLSSLSGVSVSECMRRNRLYRALMLGLMFGQFWNWWGFVNAVSHEKFTSASGFAKVFLVLAAESWVCLCADLHSHMHAVWTLIFGTSFSLMAFSLHPMLDTAHDQRVWWEGFLALLVSISACLVLLVQNSKYTGVAEHIAFIAYNITFVRFFSVSR